MTTLFEFEISKIRAGCYSIASALNLVNNMPAKGPCDLSAYDLRQSERALLDCAEMIAQTRIRLEIKEREEFCDRVEEAYTRKTPTKPDF